MKNFILGTCCGFTFMAQGQTFTNYNEEFDAPSEHWAIKDDGKISVSFKNSTMVIDAYEQNYMKFQGAPLCLDYSKDFEIETKLKFILGTRDFGYGICWGYRSWDEYNVFYITENGYTRVQTLKGTNDKNLQEWTQPKKDIIKKTGEYNILRLEKKKNNISFYVNDKKVFTTEYENVNGSGRNIGFFFQNNIKVAVDYLKVTGQMKEWKINLVENPINGYKLENLGPKVNGKESDRSPVITPDGKTLYFLSERKEESLGLSEIWHSSYTGTEWGDARHMPAPLNNAGHNFVISVTPDGNTMLVGNTYHADGSANGKGVSISLKRNGLWGIPVEQKIDGYVNVNKYCNFFLTPDATKLIMAIENDASLGDQDLFISFLKNDNTWTKPVQMGNVINTTGCDFAPFLAADNKTMYFASDGLPGYGSADVFITHRLDDTWLNWSEPKNLGQEINTANWEAYYCLSAQSDYAYMVSSGRADGYGGDDIYRIKVGEASRPDPVVMVKGKVFNKKTNELIEADIVYESLTAENTSGKAYSTKQDGFTIALPKGALYGFQAKANGFIPVSENIDLTELAAFSEKTINLYLVPIEKGQTVRLNNIFFDFSKATLRSESNTELNRLVALLNENKDMKIEIGGHTDNKGSDEFNRQLSDDRAKAVMDYLIAKNISKDRLSYKGYGETKPLGDNETEEGAQLNRRVEFVIK